MNKTILITGATDGIGLATAKLFAAKGHNLLIHGRNAEKLKEVKAQLCSLSDTIEVDSYLADLSSLSQIHSLAQKIIADHQKLDVLINNAGVFKVTPTRTADDLDIRFSVNTIAPYILTQALAPILGKSGRVINLSSAAQAPVDIGGLKGLKVLADMEAYAQSKLAITMWSKSLADRYHNNGPTIIAVNPGSLLASKMVKDGFGVAGKDISIGAEILERMSLEPELEKYSGHYFDNDKGEFSSPHPDALDLEKSNTIIDVIESTLASKGILNN